MAKVARESKLYSETSNSRAALLLRHESALFRSSCTHPRYAFAIYVRSSRCIVIGATVDIRAIDYFNITTCKDIPV